MRIGNNSLVFPIVMVASSIALELYLRGGIMTMLMTVGFAAGLFVVITISDLSYSNKVRLKREVEELESVSDSLYRGLSRNERFENSLSSAIAGIDSRGECYAALDTVARAMRSGSSFAEAVRVAAAYLSANSATLSFLKRAGSSGYSAPSASAVRAEHMHILSMRNEMMERDSGSVQRYITMSMVAGTIFPSFVLFGFMGYSILNFSTFGVSILLIALLVLIPGVYSVVRARLAGVYGV